MLHVCVRMLKLCLLQYSVGNPSPSPIIPEYYECECVKCVSVCEGEGGSARARVCVSGWEEMMVCVLYVRGRASVYCTAATATTINSDTPTIITSSTVADTTITDNRFTIPLCLL